jgi:hypothetical protein
VYASLIVGRLRAHQPTSRGDLITHCVGLPPLSRERRINVSRSKHAIDLGIGRGKCRARAACSSSRRSFVSYTLAKERTARSDTHATDSILALQTPDMITSE